MSLLYITADRIGDQSGGGLVTAQECLALEEFTQQKLLSSWDVSYSGVTVLERNSLGSNLTEPWKWDEIAVAKVSQLPVPKLAHFYSGSFPKTVEYLKKQGCKICYTIAAHDKEVSKREHEKLGWPFPYEHLTNPQLWNRYIGGYRLADVIICPSTVAEKTVRNYGPEFTNKDIRVIPHGCWLPKEGMKPLPKQFVLGYLGAIGVDKGIVYLLQAWKELNYTDGSILLIAGRDSTSAGFKELLNKYCGGCVHLGGWQQNVGDFYSRISCYVQPSCSEGFGIEVLEAMAHGRVPICSTAAGANDIVPDCFLLSVAPCNAKKLAREINSVKESKKYSWYTSEVREIAERYTWDKIRERYKQVWQEMLQ